MSCPDCLALYGRQGNFFSNFINQKYIYFKKLRSLIGPVLGGYVVDKIGFELAATGIACAFLFSALISIFFLIHELYSYLFIRESDLLSSEREPLLSN